MKMKMPEFEHHMEKSMSAIFKSALGRCVGINTIIQKG